MGRCPAGPATARGQVPTASSASSSIAADFLPTFMYCLGSRDFEVAQTALRNLPEYVLLCPGQSHPPQPRALRCRWGGLWA